MTNQAQNTNTDALNLNALTFGIEIETIGQTRMTVAQAIQGVVGGTIRRSGNYCYDHHYVDAADGRTWTVMADSSLSATKDRQAEVVSPILRYSDMATLQQVVRAVRKIARAKVDTSCGIHIHVGSKDLGARGIRNLAKTFNKQEDLISEALQVAPSRKATYCQGTDQATLKKIEKASTLDALNVAWYGYRNFNPHHYDSSRYHMLNLHSVWQKGTVEFRCFNATLHAGKIKGYVQFCLAMAQKARNSRSASSARRPLRAESSKYDFRCFLLSLGMSGDEFKTARLHLLASLTGSSAWKNGSQAA